MSGDIGQITNSAKSPQSPSKWNSPTKKGVNKIGLYSQLLTVKSSSKGANVVVSGDTSQTTNSAEPPLILKCHPELVSGSYNLTDSETSSEWQYD